MAHTQLDLVRESRFRESAFAVRAGRTGSLAWQALKKPTTAGGFIIILLLIGMAVFAPLLTEANTPDAYQMPRNFNLIDAPPSASSLRARALDQPPSATRSSRSSRTRPTASESRQASTAAWTAAS